MDRESYLSFSPTPCDGGFRMEGYWVWCGSVVEEPGKGYHMYAARWPQTHPMFEGYIYMSEIVRAWAPEMTGPYKFVEKILPCGNPDRWCGRMAHNPTVVRYGNRFLLYFIGSTYCHEVPARDKIEEDSVNRVAIYSRIRIGLAIADSPAGPWSVMEEPVLQPRPGNWDAAVVTNPAPCVMADGRIFLYYRSNTPQGLRIGLAVATKPEGPYERVGNGPVLSGFNVEDPYVWHDGNCFHMLAKDMTGNITGEPIAGAHFVSTDGIDWETAAQPKGYSRTVSFQDGQTKVLGCLERPQLLFDRSGKPRCMFAAAADGNGSFHHALNTWNIAIPLQN